LPPHIWDDRYEGSWDNEYQQHRAIELAFYHCWMPGPTPLAVLVAGRRWTIEERFQTGKAWSAWISIRFVAGAPGTAGRPWAMRRS
jgi:hypothetical protein